MLIVSAACQWSDYAARSIHFTNCAKKWFNFNWISLNWNSGVGLNRAELNWADFDLLWVEFNPTPLIKFNPIYKRSHVFIIFVKWIHLVVWFDWWHTDHVQGEAACQARCGSRCAAEGTEVGCARSESTSLMASAIVFVEQTVFHESRQIQLKPCFFSNCIWSYAKFQYQ